jgi:hypothetical protein
VFIGNSTPTATATGDIWLDIGSAYQFAQTLSSTGYTRLPNGLQIAWGTASAGGFATFSTAFQSSTYCVFLQPTSGPFDSDESDEHYFPTSISTTGFTCSTIGDGVPSTYYYLAIGT